MVGDDVNDVLALAAASVGVAMGGGTAAALEAAESALLSGRVSGVAELVALSRATLANIRQNVAVAVGLKLVFIGTTLAGLTGLWLAILADTGATVLVTLNAPRLLRWRYMAGRLIDFRSVIHAGSRLLPHAGLLTVARHTSVPTSAPKRDKGDSDPLKERRQAGTEPKDRQDGHKAGVGP